METSKPTLPCPACKKFEWWYRLPSAIGGPGGWVCGYCHPNHNVEELKNSKRDALAERVRLGNEKLWRARTQLMSVCDAGDVVNWRISWDNYRNAEIKLTMLCEELKILGFNKCFYLNEATGQRSRKCLTNPDGFSCIACPANQAQQEVYFADELFDVPARPAKTTQPVNITNIPGREELMKIRAETQQKIEEMNSVKPEDTARSAAEKLADKPYEKITPEQGKML